MLWFLILIIFRLIQNNIYLNQARVRYSYDDLSSNTGKKQFLYLIDSVLEPLVPVTKNMEDFIDIKASNVLRNSNKYKIGEYDVTTTAEPLPHQV